VTTRNEKIIEALNKYTQPLLNDPEKLNELLAREGHFDTRRTIEGTERDHLFIILKLVGPVYQSDNQRVSVDCYEYNDKKYEVTYGISEDFTIEEITFHPLSRRIGWCEGRIDAQLND